MYKHLRLLSNPIVNFRGSIGFELFVLAQTSPFVCRLHDLRHTHASLLLQAGVHPKVVQERLGHSSIRVTLDTYSHVMGGLQEAAAQHFDELLTSGKAEIENVSKMLANTPKDTGK